MTKERAHTLKTDSEHFVLIASGVKRFELRRNDRDFRVGDMLVLAEWNGTELTGATRTVRVQHMLEAHEGLAPGFVCMSIGLTHLI